jgi:DNA-binding CsgD family transcriptional regulator
VDSKNIGRLGYFRTRGLPESSRRVLLEYASDFARYREVANRLKRSPKQIKKVLADAQERLGTASQGELAKLLTACELMGRRPYATSGHNNLACRKRTGSLGESQFRLIHQLKGAGK